MHHQSSGQLQDSPFWATAGLGLPSLAFQGVLKGDCEWASFCDSGKTLLPEREALCCPHCHQWPSLGCPLCAITTHLASGEKGKPSSCLLLYHGNLVREENMVNYWEEYVPGSLCLGKNTTLPGRSKEPETHLRPFSTSVTEITFKRNLSIRTEFCKEFWTSCARSRQDSPNLQPDSPVQDVKSRQMVKAIFKN